MAKTTTDSAMGNQPPVQNNNAHRHVTILPFVRAVFIRNRSKSVTWQACTGLASTGKDIAGNQRFDVLMADCNQRCGASFQLERGPKLPQHIHDPQMKDHHSKRLTIAQIEGLTIQELEEVSRQVGAVN